MRERERDQISSHCEYSLLKYSKRITATRQHNRHSHVLGFRGIDRGGLSGDSDLFMLLSKEECSGQLGALVVWFRPKSHCYHSAIHSRQFWWPHLAASKAVTKLQTTCSCAIGGLRCVEWPMPKQSRGLSCCQAHYTAMHQLPLTLIFLSQKKRNRNSRPRADGLFRRSDYLPKILLTQPCETRSCRLISQGLTPLCDRSTILRRTDSGSGLPLT